jgi:signal transduction histidine kinase
VNVNAAWDWRSGILAALPVALLAFDGAGRLLLANAALHEAAGIDGSALPPGLARPEAIRRLAARGLFGAGTPEELLQRIGPGASFNSVRGQRLQWAEAPLPGGGCVILLRDLTDIAEALDAAQREVRDTNDILQRLASGVAVYDGQGRLRLANAALPALVGLPPSPVHPGQEFGELVRASIERGDHTPNPRGPQHERRRINDRVVRLRNQSLPDGGWLAEVTDITAEHSAERDARRRVALQDALLEALPVGVAVYGPDRVLRFVNATYNAILADSPAQVGEHLRDILMRRALKGEFGRGDPEAEVQKRLARVSGPVSFQRTRPNGLVTIHRSVPLPGGGHAMVITDVSELNAAQAEARARAELLATMLESTRHGIAMFDAEGTVITANRLAAQFCGLPPEHFVRGVHISELRALQIELRVHGDRLATDPFLAERMRAPLRGPDRYRRTNPDGTVVEVITDQLPGGGFVRSFSDVTALAHAEAEANARAATLQTVLDSIRHGVILYDGEGYVRVANALGARLAGLSPDHVKPGVHFDALRDLQAELGEHGDGPARDAYLRNRAKEPWKGDSTYVRRRPDGTMVEIRTDVTPGGGCVRTFTDITALSAAQAEIANRNAMMQVMLENMRHGIVLFDAEHRVLAANSLAADLMGVGDALKPGMHREQITRRQAERGEFGTGAEREKWIRQQLDRDWNRPQTYRRTRPDGTEIESVANPVPGGGLVLTLTDITDRVRAEAEIERRAQVLTATLNASRQALTLFDARGRVVAANAPAARLSGFEDGAALIGLTHPQVIAAARRVEGLGDAPPPGVPKGLEFERIDRSISARYQRRRADGRVVEVSSDPVPGGGYVIGITDITELAEAREEAQRRADVLAAALNASRHTITLYDSARRAIAANRFAAEVAGFPSEQAMLGLTLDEILVNQARHEYPRDPAAQSALATPIVALDRSVPHRYQRRHSDGRVFDVQSDPTPDGGFSISVADVTALVNAQEEAQRRALVLQAMLDNNRHGIVLYDRARRLVAANALAGELMGVPDLLSRPGTPLAEILAAQRARGMYQDETGGVATEQCFRDMDRSKPQRLQRTLPDGRRFDIASDPTPDGGFVISLNDVTALARAEEEAARRAAILGVMLGNIRHGIVLFDAEGRLVARNDKLVEMLELPPECLRPGTPMREMVMALSDRGEYGPGEEGARIAEAIITRPRDAAIRSVRRRPSGQIYEVVSDPTPDGGFVVTYTDVTEDRRVREELEAARAAAESASLAKSRFLATMSHELRTPLNAVIGFSEVLRGDAPPQQTQEFARSIQEAGRHLLSLIDDILDVTRAESGHLPVTLEPVALGRLLAGVERMMRPVAEQARLAIEVDAPAATPQLRADERRLRQVLINLVNNALKFTPAGGTIRLALRIEPESLLIEVSDTGIGIAVEDLSRVFEPFTQLDSQLARRYPGVGLGLYLCRLLTEAQGGTLSLDSKPEEGTRASIRFPASSLIPDA